MIYAQHGFFGFTQISKPEKKGDPGIEVAFVNWY